MKKVVIIGSGPGGYIAAIKLSSFGCKVLLIEKKEIGGTCLNVGCIPSKTLLDNLSLFEHFKEKKEKQRIFEGEEVKVKREELIEYQKKIINQLSQGLEKTLREKKIEIKIGTAEIISKGKVKVNDEIIEADEIIIATGSSPKTIPTFDIDKKDVVTSDDIWNIPDIPDSLLVIGSGPIGIEFARIYKALGADVTVAEIKDSICPVLDLEISENLERSLKRRGVKIKKSFASKFIKKEKGKVEVEFINTQTGERIKEEFSKVLIAVGRKPNAENLGLEKLGIKIEPEGFIVVNKKLQTTEKNVWAVGDVTNYPQLAHTASFQARIVSENILGIEKEFIDYKIPSCIYGYPEVAFVGYTEEELKENKVKYRVGKSLFLTNGKAKASGHTEGIIKILMDEMTEEILGAHIIGKDASSLIHELTVAMQNNLKVEDLTNTIHAHPTYSEIIHEALEDCLGEKIHA